MSISGENTFPLIYNIDFEATSGVDCVKYLINNDKISVAGELRPAIKKYLTVKIQYY